MWKCLLLISAFMLHIFIVRMVRYDEDHHGVLYFIIVLVFFIFVNYFGIRSEPKYFPLI